MSTYAKPKRTTGPGWLHACCDQQLATDFIVALSGGIQIAAMRNVGRRYKALIQTIRLTKYIADRG